VSFVETYRGTVHQWQVDNVEHFTVAYYFERFQDATAALLHALGLARDAAGTRAITECRVRYLKELRVGDILHIRSGVVAVEDGVLVLGHEVVESASGTVCTTVEQRAHGPAEPDRVAALRGAFTVPPEPPRTAPATASGGTGFIDTSRDTVKPWEVDECGAADWPAQVHRFSAANAHVIAAFGMTPVYMRDQRKGFSTFQFDLRFVGAARVGDLVLVRTGLLHVGSSSIRLVHAMTNAVTGERVATLEQSGVHLDLDARRPAPLPDDMRARARALLVS